MFPAASSPSEFSLAYSLSTTTTRLTLPLRSKPSCTRVPGRTSFGSIALPSLSTKRTFLPSIYDTGFVSGEDCTTIGEGGSTGLRPGLNAVTVPILTAPVVICVGARCTWPVCPTADVFATGACPNARGAIIAQARTIVIRLMCFPFIELTFRSCFAEHSPFGCLAQRDKKSPGIHEPSTLRLRTIFRSILNDHSLSQAVRTGTRVINVNTLTRVDLSCHRLTGCIHDLCGCAQPEADRSLGTIDHNRFASLIRLYQTHGMGRGSLCGRWLRRARFLALRALCLCERQRRNHCTNKNDNYSSHEVLFR
jgi:hypothetical protein